MAVVSFPTSVTPGADATVRQGTAGAAIAAGELVYLNVVSGRLELADADGSALTAEVAGVAINSAPSAGQAVDYVTDGTVNGFTALKPGQPYLLSNTPGDACEATGDLTEDTSYVSSIGIGLSATALKVKICNSGVRMNLA